MTRARGHVYMGVTNMNSLSQIRHTITYMGLPLLFAMVLHGYALAWMAEKCGDSTAKLQGRLTINPLAHIHPFWTVILPLICVMLPGIPLFGWTKMIPIDHQNMRQSRRDLTLVAAAGIGTNLLLAIASALFLALILTIEPTLSLKKSAEADAFSSPLATLVLRPIAVMALYSVLINVVFVVWNLLPFSPFAGSLILRGLLPLQPGRIFARSERYMMLLFVVLIVFDEQLHVIHAITGTFYEGFSSTILSTALALRPGITE